MAYLALFGLLIGGYALVDWGFQRSKSRRVTMWYLLTGQAPAAQPGSQQPIPSPGGGIIGVSGPLGNTPAANPDAWARGQLN